MRRLAAQARAACEAALASRDGDELVAALELASTLPQSYAWARAAQVYLSRLAHEGRIRDALHQLVGR
eukprot:5468077-Prymnesium_polylepis.1